MIKVVSPDVQVDYQTPSITHPFWSVRLSGLKAPIDGKLRYVFVNDRREKEFIISSGGRERYLRELKQNEQFELLVRCHWQAGDIPVIRFAMTQGRSHISATGEFTCHPAPAIGEYWNNAWPYCESIIVRETSGHPQPIAPVHVGIRLHQQTVCDDLRDLRLVEFNFTDNTSTDIPFQIIRTDVWNEPDLIKREPYRYQPTVFIELAFLTQLKSYEEKIYLLFHGNNRAEKPEFDSSLNVRYLSDGSVEVENEFYSVKLHPHSNMIDEVHIKQAGKTLYHHLEREGTIHWNPGIYSPPRPWVHTNDWQNPHKYFSDAGPVCFVAKTWGTMPEEIDEVKVAVTYIFYANSPLIFVKTFVRVDEDISTQSLRNGEFVFDRKLIDTFAYRDFNGELKEIELDSARPHPGHGAVIAPDTPWMLYYHKQNKIGFAQINVSFGSDCYGKNLTTSEDPYIYLAVGPWVYAARTLAYSYGSKLPNSTTIIPRNNFYWETAVLKPLRVKEDVYDELDSLSSSVRKTPWAHIHNQPLKQTPDRFVMPLLRYPIEQVPDEEVLDADNWRKENVKTWDDVLRLSKW